MLLLAIRKSRNGESGSGMRGMMVMRGIRLGMMGIRVEMPVMRGIKGKNAGNQGANAGNKLKWKKMKVYKVQFSFLTEIKKKNKKQNGHKMLIFVLWNERHKALVPGSHVKVSYNDPKQRYYLNGMRTCGPSVMILFQWFQSQFSANEKLHFTQGYCLPRDFELKY